MPIKKPAKIPASKTLALEAPTTSSRSVLGKDSDPDGQTVNPLVPEAIDTQVSLLKDVTSVGPTIEATCTILVTFEVELDLAGDIRDSDSWPYWRFFEIQPRGLIGDFRDSCL